MIGAFLKRLIPENIAGLLGLVGTLIKAVRELLMVVLRILNFFGIFTGVIDKVSAIFDTIEKGWKSVVDFFLTIGG